MHPAPTKEIFLAQRINAIPTLLPHAVIRGLNPRPQPHQLLSPKELPPETFAQPQIALIFAAKTTAEPIAATYHSSVRSGSSKHAS